MLNWERIISSAGLAFFTSLSANFIMGNSEAIINSLLVAAIYSGLTFFTEMKTESDGEIKKQAIKTINLGLLV